MVLTSLPPAPGTPAEATAPSPPGWLAAAGTASLGAGAVHAVAAGAHGAHLPAVLAFTALAVVQLLWGAVALVRRDRPTALVGVGVGATALAGWLLAKTGGLPVDGLGAPEPVQLADATAAGLAAATAGLAGTAAVLRRAVPLPFAQTALSLGALALVAMVATPGHGHAGPAAHQSAAHAGAPHAGTAHAGTAHEEPVPYDPALPIDLGGTPGVTPQQQAAAENLVAVTLAGLPQWADAAVAERAGFRSIGDGFTGTEHLVNRAYLDDGVLLDPDRPESLVYDTSTGTRRLVAAMYMLVPGTPLEDVPDVGGALVQWHTHEDLCYDADGKVRGVTDAEGACPAGLVKPVPAPMVHVWITPHRCGPFAALEGIAGGRIADGETRLCDHAHGA